VAYLEAGPRDSLALARDVLGIARAARTVAERLAEALLGSDARVTRIADGRWCLAGEGASPPLPSCRFAVVDVETTGWSLTRGGRIIEVAVVRCADGRAETAFEGLVDPEGPVAPAVMALTGIAPRDLAGRPAFAGVADQVLDALLGAVFVAHNVRFDWTFVASELRAARGILLGGPRLCTLRLSRRLLPGLDSRGLDAVARALGVRIEGRHRAGGDARATAQVLLRLLDLAREAGARTLADLATVRA